MKRVPLLLVALAALVTLAAVTGSAASLAVRTSSIDTIDQVQAAPTTTTSTTTPGDNTPPAVVSREYFDVAPIDGKIDRIVVTYDEKVAFTGAPGAWTLPSRPAGMNQSPNSVNVVDAVVTLQWTGGLSTNPATGDTVTLTLDNTGAVLSDLAGNPAPTLTAAPVLDKAAPVPMTVVLANVTTPNQPAVDDTVTITWSEELDAESICPGSSGSFIVNGNVGGLQARLTDVANTETLTVTGTVCSSGSPRFGSLTMGTANFLATGVTATFAANAEASRTRVSWTASTRVLQLTLGTRSGSVANQSGYTATYTPPPGTASTAITDLAGNVATTTRTSTGAF